MEQAGNIDLEMVAEASFRASERPFQKYRLRRDRSRQRPFFAVTGAQAEKRRLDSEGRARRTIRLAQRTPGMQVVRCIVA